MMLDAKVLIVCDDLETTNIWGYCLRQRGLQVSTVNQVEAALNMWSQEIPDLVVLDIIDPKFDQIALVKELRPQAIAPILLLSPDTSETYMLTAYQAGVDEFIPKLVSPVLFLAKIKAWLRRSWTVPANALDNLQINPLCLDPAKRQVVIGEREPIRLTNLEFRLLHLLMSNPGRAIDSSEIIERVWGHYGDGDSNLLKNLVYRLRRKIDPDQDQQRYIHTEAGLGYKFFTE